MHLLRGVRVSSESWRLSRRGHVRVCGGVVVVPTHGLPDTGEPGYELFRPDQLTLFALMRRALAADRICRLLFVGTPAITPLLGERLKLWASMNRAGHVQHRLVAGLLTQGV